MCPKQIVLDPDLQRLQQEGYEIEVRSGHLLVHSVPYVNAHREVLRGIVVTNLSGNVGALGAPGDHQVWFAGEFPCHHTGAPIDGIRHTSERVELWPGFEAQHRFSNKPYGKNGYPDYYSKMKNYISIISNEAKEIDPNATPTTFNVIVSSDEDAVFRYWDTASTRVNILPISAKLASERIGIVGLGGTGAYILDLVVKTPVKEIHLFDGDTLLQHNAFRAPGAVSIEDLQEKPYKVDYYARRYGAMHSGIVPHCRYLTDDNISELSEFNFVFLCVDKGAVRQLVGSHLQTLGIPFIDVGMDLWMAPEGESILGTCRATLCTPEKSEHFSRRAYLAPNGEDDLYRTNIQVADMNALNAALAVLMWKQHRGFYQNLVKAFHTTYSINSHSLTRDEMDGDPEDAE